VPGAALGQRPDEVLEVFDVAGTTFLPVAVITSFFLRPMIDK
jgi:hypothetical protein